MPLRALAMCGQRGVVPAQKRHSATGRVSTLALWICVCQEHLEAFLNTPSPWNWEQGRLEYFQFDELRKVARFGAAVTFGRLTGKSLKRPWGFRSCRTTMPTGLGGTTAAYFRLR